MCKVCSCNLIKIQIWDALCEMIYQTIRCKNYETSHILLVILEQITPLPPWAMLEEIFNCFSPSYDNSNIEIGGRGEIILLSQQFLHLIVGRTPADFRGSSLSNSRCGLEDQEIKMPVWERVGRVFGTYSFSEGNPPKPCESASRSEFSNPIFLVSCTSVCWNGLILP